MSRKKLKRVKISEGMLGEEWNSMEKKVKEVLRKTKMERKTKGKKREMVG